MNDGTLLLNSKIKVAAVSLNQFTLDFDQNRERVLTGIAAAKEVKASLIGFSELCLSGYGCEDWFLSESTLASCLQSLKAIIPHTHGIAVVVGLPLSIGGFTYNAAACVADGKLRGFYLKQFLANEGVYYEPRWFKASHPGHLDSVTLWGEAFPAGDLVFDIAPLRIGFELCEDAWVTTRPARRCLERGVNCIINPSSSHFALGKIEQRKALVRNGSSIIQGAYLYCNALGNESGRLVFDGGNLIAFDGEILCQGRRFSFKEVVVDTCVLQCISAPSTSSDEGRIVTDFVLEESAESYATAPLSNWESSPELRFEEFSRAVALGLGDYRRRSNVTGFVISLSGGIDSTAVAVLVAYLKALATSELNEHATAYLGHDELLTCIYQATAQSSETTHSAAKSVAEGLRARWYDINIEPLVQLYLSIVTDATNRPLTWEHDDITLQNIQARVRSPAAWLLANMFRALLLTTSNRSEASVGYCTMDGDTSGGLCPLGGVSKDFLREWLQWVAQKGIEEAGPFPFVTAVLALPPTAELRPGGTQTDEGDLMPYKTLQQIERQVIFEKRAPQSVTAGTDDQVNRFLSLWAHSQWKRERLAPSFHIDEYSVDPKTWCRFPILSKPLKK